MADTMAALAAGTGNANAMADLECLQRAMAAEAQMKCAIDHQRKHTYQHRAELERKIDAEEAIMERHRIAALQLDEKARVASQRVEHDTKELWTDMEDALVATQDVDADLSDLQRKLDELRERQRSKLEVSRCLHKLYTSATGIRWDAPAGGRPDAVRKLGGYVAVGSLKRFDLGGLSKKQAQDKVWETIEASLPPASLDHVEIN